MFRNRSCARARVLGFSGKSVGSRWVRLRWAGLLLALTANTASAVTFEFIVPPIPESASSIDAVFRVSASAAETAGGQLCFVGGEISTTTPSVGTPIAEDGSDYLGPSPEFFDFVIPASGADEVQEFALTIPILADQQVEPIQETFGLQFFADEGSIGQDCFGTTIPETVTANAVINDDDALQYAYAPTSITVAENAGTVTADLTLLNPGDAPFEYSAIVPTSSQSGTAFAGDDFEAIVDNLTFSEVQTTQSITVTLIDDNEVESDEVFQIASAAGVVASDGQGNPYLISITNAVAVTIVSEDVADTLSVTQASVSVAEDVGVVEVSVVRTGVLLGAVAVDYAAIGGSATQPGDFQATTGTLNFADGEAGPLVISVPIVDDGLNEIVESFQVQLTGPQGNAVLGAAVTTVSVIDNDTDDLSFSVVATSVDEGAGTVVLEVSRTGTALDEVSLEYSTVAGTATENADYVNATGVLSFGPGEFGPQQVSIDIIDDLVDELDETFDVVLSNPTGAASLGAASATVTVVDNDEAPVVTTYEFTNPSISAIESAGDATLFVTRSGDLSSSGSVDFQTVQGSAIDGSDFVAQSGSLTFAAGEAGPLSVLVALLDDGLSETDEQFSIGLQNPVAGIVSAAAGTAVVTIQDNDNPGGAPDVTLQGLPGALVVDSFSSTVVGASRFTDLSQSSVDPDVSSGAVNVTYQFTIPTDAVTGEQFQDRVVVSFGAQQTLVERYIRIEVIDPPPAFEGDLVFTSADLSFTEDQGSVTVSVARVNGTAGTVTVDYSATSDTAVAGDDFELTPGALSWVDGEAGEKSFVIDIVDDAIAEESETFTLALGNFVASGSSPAPRVTSSVGGGVAGASGAGQALGLGSPSSIVVTINDNDAAGSAGNVAFVQDSITVDENDGTVDIEVARSGSPVGAVSVDWATIADSAEEGDDFVAATGTLLWPDGDADNKTITIELTADADVEGIEEFSLELSNPQGVEVGTAAVTTIAISDVGQGLAQVPGLNPEELAFATALDSSCENLIADADPNDPDQQDLLFICGTVRTGLETPEQVREAIDALSGDELVTAATSTLKLMGLQHNTFRNRLSGLRTGNVGSFDVTGLAVEIDGQYLSGAVLEELFGALTGGAAGDDGFGRLSFYVNGKLEFGEKDRDSANRGYDFDAQMLTLGADYRLGENMFVGAALGYEMADVKFAQGGALDVGGWKGSVYGSYFSGDAFFIDAQASYGRDDYSSKRRIVYDYVGGSVDRTAEGDTDGDQFATGIASGFDFNRGRFTFGPNVALSFFNVGVKSFTEEGAGGLNLEIGRQKQQSLTFTGGAHASYVINTRIGVLIPNARIDYVHEFLSSPEFSNVRFAADPLTGDPSTLTAPLSVQAETIDKNYLLWSIGTSLQMTHGVSGYVNYQSTEGYTGLKLQQIAYGFRLEKTY